MKHHTPRDYKLLFIFSCTHTIRNANLLTLSPDYLVAVHCCIITVRQSRCDVVLHSPITRTINFQQVQARAMFQRASSVFTALPALLYMFNDNF